jgi:hypothetical protein
VVATDYVVNRFKTLRDDEHAPPPPGVVTMQVSAGRRLLDAVGDNERAPTSSCFISFVIFVLSTKSDLRCVIVAMSSESLAWRDEDDLHVLVRKVGTRAETHRHDTHVSILAPCDIAARVEGSAVPTNTLFVSVCFVFEGRQRLVFSGSGEKSLDFCREC